MSSLFRGMNHCRVSHHLLDSLVMFTRLGDEVHVEPADELSLKIEGPFAGDMGVDGDNLVLRASRSFGAAITLHTPGMDWWRFGRYRCGRIRRSFAGILSLRLALMLLFAWVTRLRSIGNELERLGPAPMPDEVLVNLNVGVPAATAFSGLASKPNPPMPDDMPDPFGIDEWVHG